MPIRPEMRARYPSDWALRSRFVRFVRAGGRCEWCGAVHGQPHPVTGSLVVLTAAHVHDLRHTVGMRLREAGVAESTVADVLWHSTRSMTQHYSTAQIVELHGALEKITADSGAWNKSLATLRAEHQARQMEGRKVANG